jgi:hypothetical protein
MEDKTAAEGLQQGVADDSTISPEVLRAVAALDARLARVLGTLKILPPQVIHNVNDLEEEQLSLGDRIADWFAAAVGSWKFIELLARRIPLSLDMGRSRVFLLSCPVL